MGASMTAYLLLDDNTPQDEAPFTYFPSVWDLSMDLGLCGAKDYEFYAAICGIRNEADMTPLFPHRGLPSFGQDESVPRALADLAEEDVEPVGWLTLSEIERAMDHMEVDRALLGKSLKFVLKTMQSAEEHFGKDRIRLVFHVSD